MNDTPELRKFLHDMLATRHMNGNSMIRYATVIGMVRQTLTALDAKRDSAPTIAKQLAYEDDGNILFAATAPRARMAP